MLPRQTGRRLQWWRNGRTAQMAAACACDSRVCSRCGPGRQRVPGPRLDPECQRRRSTFRPPQTSAAALSNFARNPGGISAREARRSGQTEVPRPHRAREWPDPFLSVCGPVLFLNEWVSVPERFLIEMRTPSRKRYLLRSAPINVTAMTHFSADRLCQASRVPF